MDRTSECTTEAQQGQTHKEMLHSTTRGQKPHRESIHRNKATEKHSRLIKSSFPLL